ncbi:MAG: ferredoxin [Planctomycetota bacterium]|nr:MAG: ferredoxin [Planctomycetota bacterium]
MPSIKINGKVCEFEPGEKIIDVANRCGEEIPQYCYHPGLSVPAQCRICLAEIWAPNPRNDGKVEPMMGGKLLPTCATECAEGMEVYTTSPKAVANQKAVMEYLLINHPLDCAVCDQAGECTLQDFSYRYGRGTSRFEEVKVKQPKKDLGPHVLIYSDRCIMCTRCVRFAREIPGTGELMIDGRGNISQIDVFPGVALDNPLSGNVVDLCPVGALLEKDFLFAQRVWFLKRTPSIDGITASGDNIWIEHNQGRVYRVKPRTNMAVNKWWISDEVRFGWKFVHSEDRLSVPMRRQHGILAESGWQKTIDQMIESVRGKRVGLLVSPMLSCEDAFLLAQMARRLDPDAVLAMGPVPIDGEDQIFPPGASPDDPKAFRICAEKAPNARGVRRVLDAFGGSVGFEEWLEKVSAGQIEAAIVTGNYPSTWATDAVLQALERPHLVTIDTLSSPLVDMSDIVLASATWAEKAGTFENHAGMLQAFEQAIPVVGQSKAEAQIALDVMAVLDGQDLQRPEAGYDDMIVDEGPGQVPEATAAVAVPRARLYNAADTRTQMAESHEALGVFVREVQLPAREAHIETDMPMVEL